MCTGVALSLSRERIGARGYSWREFRQLVRGEGLVNVAECSVFECYALTIMGFVSGWKKKCRDVSKVNLKDMIIKGCR